MRGCLRTIRPASTCVVVVDTELAVVVVRSRQLKRRPNLIGIGRQAFPSVQASSSFLSSLSQRVISELLLDAYSSLNDIHQTGFLFVNECGILNDPMCGKDRTAFSIYRRSPFLHGSGDHRIYGLLVNRLYGYSYAVRMASSKTSMWPHTQPDSCLFSSLLSIKSDLSLHDPLVHCAVFLSSLCGVLLPTGSWISLPGLATTAAAGVPVYLSSRHTAMARFLLPSSIVCPWVAWLIGQERRRNVYCMLFIYPSMNHPNDGPAACTPWYLASSLGHSSLITTVEMAACTHTHTHFLHSVCSYSLKESFLRSGLWDRHILSSMAVRGLLLLLWPLIACYRRRNMFDRHEIRRNRAQVNERRSLWV